MCVEGKGIGSQWVGNSVTGLEGCNNQFGLCPRTEGERWVTGSFGSG